MDIFEEGDSAGGNQPEYTVSELSGALKRVIEGEFGYVRVRAEVGRVMRAASGHLYFDLKDERSVISAVGWKGQVARMTTRPEEGLEVIATGRMTIFPGQSKYQLIVDDVVPAGAGALMAMLEKRRKALEAEGLFSTERKRPLPYLPNVIGVVTSPSGAVIRDILHRLRDRFARHVLIWPVVVQGKDCPTQVAEAIRGFNALPKGGDIPRPDLLIVARGGGSLEDLWGFNEEVVVRAVADSLIPLISAVGHETDTTLIDYAADRRAPTPTAAAEMSVPVRRELFLTLDSLASRLSGSMINLLSHRDQRLRDLSRIMPSPDALMTTPAQRLDIASGRLSSGLSLAVSRKNTDYQRRAARLAPPLLKAYMLKSSDDLRRLADLLSLRYDQKQERIQTVFDKWASRLAPALGRLLRGAVHQLAQDKGRLASMMQRMELGQCSYISGLERQVGALDRMRQTLGYTETLRRGYVVVRTSEARNVVTNRAAAQSAGSLEIEFSDGFVGPLLLSGRGRAGSAAFDSLAAKPKGKKQVPPDQGTLF